MQGRGRAASSHRTASYCVIPSRLCLSLASVSHLQYLILELSPLAVSAWINSSVWKTVSENQLGFRNPMVLGKGGVVGGGVLN